GAVPAALLTRTGQAVSLLAAGQSMPAALFSPEVGPLAEDVLNAMAVAKQKTVGVWLVLVALVLAGGMAAHQTLAALVPAGGPAPTDTPAARQTPLGPAPEAPGEVRCFTVEEWAWSVSFSPNGRRILIGVGGAGVPVRVCDFGSGQEVLRTA